MSQQHENVTYRARRFGRMRTIALPSTRVGWWASGLAAVFWICLGVAMAFVAAGQHGGNTLLDNPWLSGVMLLALAAASIGGLLAVRAIVWRGERSLLVIVTLLPYLFNR